MLRKSFYFISLCLILSLLLTACGGVQAQDKTFTIGIVNNDYLPKPVDIDRLFSMLQVWLYR